ncbi:hypothetical protein [Streptomyces rhizosphaericus]|uniref:Uncharacterized protein n=1 Tax=Streptomyces rhizosphaericus TaxID=114699 RepID=A0A6G4AKK9_9ACTN|nr:hypothetical protein [Streptomyces rhizosphaericus]NEW73770.1 hypothetical protein [Streptomyces rhizosphaericus]
MVTFLDTQADARRFAALLDEYDRRLKALERSTQAAHTSIEGGTMDIYDADGNLKGSVGMQPDGGVALVPVHTDPPPTPMPPTVEPVLAGLVVGWDGTWDDSYATPTDFSLIQVHLGPTEDFPLDATTLVATITAMLGGTVTVAVEGYDPVWVRLVAQNTASITGPPSTAVQGTPRQAVPKDLIDGIIDETKLAAQAVSQAKVKLGAIGTDQLAVSSVTAEKIVALGITAEKIAALAVTADKLAALSVTTDKLAANAVTASKILAGSIDATHIKVGALTADRLALGTDGNIIADPSFENPISAQRVTASPYWSIVTPGNETPKALQVNAANPTAITRSMTLAVQPAVPGQKMWLTIDYLASEDWSGIGISFYAQWQDANGQVLGYSTITTGDADAVRGSWQRLTGVPDAAAPAGTTQVRVACSTVDSTAGSVAYDNASCRVVLASGVAGARAELSPQGLLLYDSAGQEAVALVTGRPNYLTLATDGTPVATIDQDGGAGFQRLAVAENLTVGGSDWTEYLNQLPRGILAIDYQSSTVTASGSEMGFVELDFEADPERMYRFVFEARANPSAAGGELQLRLRDGAAEAPTITSKQLHIAVHHMALGNSFTARLEHIALGSDLGAGMHRTLITFANAYQPTGQTVTLSGGSGSLGKYYVEDIGPRIPETGGYNTGGGTATPPVTKYSKTYAASWSGSYANRSSYNTSYGNRCVQGYYSSGNGTQAALVGFPSALSTDLSGAKIIKAEIYLYFEHWYSNAGGKAVIKAHKHTSRPTVFSSDSESQTISWKRNEGKWVDITGVFDSTSWRGIALDPNSTSSTYYGIARGVGQTNPPRLRVTYTK